MNTLLIPILVFMASLISSAAFLVKQKNSLARLLPIAVLLLVPAVGHIGYLQQSDPIFYAMSGISFAMVVIFVIVIIARYIEGIGVFFLPLLMLSVLLGNTFATTENPFRTGLLSICLSGYFITIGIVHYVSSLANERRMIK